MFLIKSPFVKSYKIKFSLGDFSKKSHIGYLLNVLGVDKELITKKFWQNNSKEELSWIFSIAQKIYRQKIKLYHPDIGGNPNLASNFNYLWSIIEKRFENHINPRIIIPNFENNRQYDKTPNDSFVFCCKFCKNKFILKKNRYNKKRLYCSDICREKNRSKKRFYKNVYHRKCAHVYCNVRFVTNKKDKLYHSLKCRQNAVAYRYRIKYPDKLKKIQQNWRNKNRDKIREKENGKHKWKIWWNSLSELQKEKHRRKHRNKKRERYNLLKINNPEKYLEIKNKIKFYVEKYRERNKSNGFS